MLAMVRAAAFVMKMPDEVMRNEKIKDHEYDIVLVSSLIVCVPLALLCAVATKLWRAKRAGLLAIESGPKAAFDRYRFGLASAEDRRELRQYFFSLAPPPVEGHDYSSSTSPPSFQSTWAGTVSTTRTAAAMDGDATSRPPAAERDTNAMRMAAMEVEMCPLSDSDRSKSGEQ